MKTLFVSDLDGTLLNSSGMLTQYTRETLNCLIQQGLLFSIATARSAVTCRTLLEGLDLRLPLVLMNGVFLYDSGKKKYISSRPFPAEVSQQILAVFERFGKSPFQYTLPDDGALCVGFLRLELGIQREFYQARAGLGYQTFRQCQAYDRGGDTVYYALIDRREALAPIKQELEKIEGLRCAFYQDNYSSYWYLEVFSAQAGKAGGVEMLRQFAGARRTVVFGDNFNDLDMFRAADEAFAVANAAVQVRRAADGILAANDEDGVARYLALRMEKGERP